MNSPLAVELGFAQQALQMKVPILARSVSAWLPCWLHAGAIAPRLASKVILIRDVCLARIYNFVA
jgi:hypothetical protein